MMVRGLEREERKRKREREREYVCVRGYVSKVSG